MSSEEGYKNSTDWLLDVLALLGSDVETQTEYLRRSNVEVDELALMFDDAYRLTQARWAEKGLGSDVATSLSFVDSLLDEMTESSDDSWSLAALATSQKWEAVRRECRRLVHVINEQRPD